MYFKSSLRTCVKSDRWLSCYTFWQYEALLIGVFVLLLGDFINVTDLNNFESFQFKKPAVSQVSFWTVISLVFS